MASNNNQKQAEKNQESGGVEEVVVQVDRVTRVVKGGRRLRFRALVVVGNRNGMVGAGVAKGQEVQAAVQKAVSAAKKNMITVSITSNGSISHEVSQKYGASNVLLKPASAGTSVIAGGPVRSVVSLAGIENILSKSIGSNNKMNVVMATINALKSLNELK